MRARSRESRLSAAFIALADTLADDYDVMGLAHILVTECMAIFDVQAAALFLADATGMLHPAASSSAQGEQAGSLRLGSGAGPHVLSFETGALISVPDIAEDGGEWPDFRALALEQGFHSVDAIPMTRRGDSIGSLALMRSRSEPLDSRDREAARALADVATIGILQERVSRQRLVASEQLQHALDSRTVIEQAKGMVSILGSLDVDEAKILMRDYARSRSIRMHDVASSILDRSLSVTAIMSERSTSKRSTSKGSASKRSASETSRSERSTAR